jgi:hypothetical protein
MKVAWKACWAFEDVVTEDEDDKVEDDTRVLVLLATDLPPPPLTLPPSFHPVRFLVLDSGDPRGETGTTGLRCCWPPPLS